MNNLSLIMTEITANAYKWNLYIYHKQTYTCMYIQRGGKLMQCKMHSYLSSQFSSVNLLQKWRCLCLSLERKKWLCEVFKCFCSFLSTFSNEQDLQE